MFLSHESLQRPSVLVRTSAASVRVLPVADPWHRRRQRRHLRPLGGRRRGAVHLQEDQVKEVSSAVK